MATVKINKNLLKLGEELAWDISAEDGTLLLQRGMTISTESQLKKIIALGYYTQTAAGNEVEVEKVSESLSSYDKALKFIQTMEYCHSKIKPIIEDVNLNMDKISDTDKEQVLSKIKGIAQVIQQEAKNKSKLDAMLAAIQLNQQSSYYAIHSIRCAIFCAAMSIRLELSEEERTAIIIASLTDNLGILDIPPELLENNSSVTMLQKFRIYHHPEQSVEVLKKFGITDKLWLNDVLQHHERIDGSGYPLHLNKDKISKSAQIMANAVAFSTNQNAQHTESEIDPDMTKQFLDEFGKFRPGTMVSLKNKEIAVVTQRGVDNIENPVVYSILNSQGAPNHSPFARDVSQDEFAIKSITNSEKALKVLDTLVKKLWSK